MGEKMVSTRGPAVKTYVMSLRNEQERPPQIVACTSDLEAMGRAFMLLSLNPDCTSVEVACDSDHLFRIERDRPVPQTAAG